MSEKKPLYKKAWFWLIIAVILFFAAIIQDKKANGSFGDQKEIISEEEYKSQCEHISYEDIARNPDGFKGKKAVFRGKVLQVLEDGNDVVLRIDVTEDKYGFWDDTIYVEYTRKSADENRILEDDIVMVYGRIKGIKTYKALLGNNISIPHLEAEYINLASNQID